MDAGSRLVSQELVGVAPRRSSPPHGSLRLRRRGSGKSRDEIAIVRSRCGKARGAATVNASLLALVSFRKAVSWTVDPMETVCVPNKGAGTHCALSESRVRTATQRVSCELGVLALWLGSESCRLSPFGQEGGAIWK